MKKKTNSVDMVLNIGGWYTSPDFPSESELIKRKAKIKGERKKKPNTVGTVPTPDRQFVGRPLTHEYMPAHFPGLISYKWLHWNHTNLCIVRNDKKLLKSLKEMTRSGFNLNFLNIAISYINILYFYL